MPQILQEESQMSTLFSVGNNIFPSKIWNFKMLFGTQNEYEEYMGGFWTKNSQIMSIKWVNNLLCNLT